MTSEKKYIKQTGCRRLSEGLLQVGAGFWMQDTASVRAQAEALAKAKYAETRDPKSCALFYAALGKKNLLQVLLDCLSGLSTYPEIWTGLAFSRSGDLHWCQANTNSA